MECSVWNDGVSIVNWAGTNLLILLTGFAMMFLGIDLAFHIDGVLGLFIGIGGLVIFLGSIRNMEK